MPRMYNKRVGVHAVDKRVRKKIEGRDAIVWSIDAANDVVNLKIQGSDILYKAYYHQVLNAVPNYCRVGAAVTLRHRRGNKGYAEVSGTGRAIPTPTVGGSALPVIPLEDMILSGMTVFATEPTAMWIGVNAGTYRMDNTLYVFSEANNFFYLMDDPPPLIMGTDNVNMGGDYFAVEIAAAPGTPAYGRYDILVVGPHDGLIDVVTGSAVNFSTTAPTMPTTPVDHVLVGFVLVQYGDTVVTDDMINRSYSSPGPEEVTITISGDFVNVDQELLWNAAAPPQYSCIVTITAKDQYGTAWNFGGVHGTLTKVGGYGQMYGTYTGWDEDSAESNAMASVAFVYMRDQTEPEFSPIFVYEHIGFATTFVLTILDLAGDPM